MEIIEASRLPSDEKVHLKKGWFGEWRVVYPLKNDDGSWNWFNIVFGSKGNIIFLLLLLIVGCVMYFGVKDLISNYQIIADNPCDFCYNCQEQTRKVVTSINKFLLERPIDITYINWSNLT